MLSVWLARLFFVTLLTTEFFYIEVAGGMLRPYHLFLVAILVIFLPGIAGLWRSPTFRCLALVNLVTIISALLAADPRGALTSYVLFALNSSLAMAIAAIVNLRVVPVGKAVSLLYNICVISVLFALVQFAAFKGAGINLSLSPPQQHQIAAGFAPAFFTEANTYAKFLIVPFFIFLPLVVNYGFRRRMLIFYIFIIAAFFINFMRTAFVGIVSSLLLMAVYYLMTGRLSFFARRFHAFFLIGAFLLLATAGTGLTVSDYNLYKLTSLFDLDAMMSDGSWGYRSLAMKLALQQTLDDPSRIILGSGWGQVYAYMGQARVQVGGADLINFFIYDGVIGVVAYLSMIFFALRGAMRRARKAVHPYESCLAEGVFFALLACIVTAFVSGMMLMPSFWLLIGLAIVFDCATARQTAGRRLVPTGRPAIR